MTDRSARPVLPLIIAALAGTLLAAAPLPADPGPAEQVITAVDHTNQDRAGSDLDFTPEDEPWPREPVQRV